MVLPFAPAAAASVGMDNTPEFTVMLPLSPELSPVSRNVPAPPALLTLSPIGALVAIGAEMCRLAPVATLIARSPPIADTLALAPVALSKLDPAVALIVPGAPAVPRVS